MTTRHSHRFFSFFSTNRWSPIKVSNLHHPILSTCNSNSKIALWVLKNCKKSATELNIETLDIIECDRHFFALLKAVNLNKRLIYLWYSRNSNVMKQRKRNWFHSCCQISVWGGFVMCLKQFARLTAASFTASLTPVRSPILRQFSFYCTFFMSCLSGIVW